jgi:hypothetical protein
MQARVAENDEMNFRRETKQDTFWALMTACVYCTIAACVLGSILIYCTSKSLVNAFVPEVAVLGLAALIFGIAAAFNDL